MSCCWSSSGRLVACAVCLPSLWCVVVSAWRGIIPPRSRCGGRGVWVVWMGRLLAVLVVYLYCQLVVYIV